MISHSDNFISDMDDYYNNLINKVNYYSTLLDTIVFSPNDYVIFDIDETLLFNAVYYYLSKNILTKSEKEEFDRIQHLDLGIPIYPVINLIYNKIKHKCKIILLTARNIIHKNITLINLNNYNIIYDNIHFKENPDECTCVYKKRIRDSYSKIKLNVGDQLSDFVNDNSEYQFILPCFYRSECKHVL